MSRAWQDSKRLRHVHRSRTGGTRNAITAAEGEERDDRTYTDRVPEERGTLSRQPKARNVTTARFMCVPQRSEERTRGSANRQDVGVATQAARRESAECRRPEGESCPSAGRHQKRHAGRKASAEHLRCRRASLKPPIASQRGCFHQ